MNTALLPGNRTYLVPLIDGYVVEAVYYGSGTLCLSTQVGCALACPFCASGARGFKRQLTGSEMQGQLLRLRQDGIEPRRLTLSGIGEPLHNWEQVRPFIDACQKESLKVSVTTTAASLHFLAELFQSAANGVMISLHGADAATHRRLLPRGPDFHLLCREIDRIYPLLSRRQRRKIGINYLLLDGENDNDGHLLALSSLLSRWPDFTLHLLRYNPVNGRNFSTNPAKIDLWHDTLTRGGASVRRPNRWRTSPDGGCGTLFLRTLSPAAGLED